MSREPWKIVCAWCGRFIGGNRKSKKVSHGICDPCLIKEIKKLNKGKRHES